MEASSSSLSTLVQPMFDEENYQAWAMKMQVYMEGCDYWEAVEDDYEVAALSGSLSLNQIRYHKEVKTRKSKAKTYMYVVVSLAIFYKIMACDFVKKICDFLKSKYQGDEKIKNMKGLNLVKDLRDCIWSLRQSKSTRPIWLALKIRQECLALTSLTIGWCKKSLFLCLTGIRLAIASLENTKNLSQIKLVEFVSALQEPEQRGR